MSKIALQSNSSGTGTFSIASPNSNTDRTLTLPDNTGTVVSTGSSAVVSQSMLATNVAGTGPAFSVSLNSNQNTTSTVTTKVQFSTKEFDTASCFDNTTNYRFTPNVAGYYQLNAVCGMNGTCTRFRTLLYKNGSIYKLLSDLSSQVNSTGSGSLVYANGSTDYFEVYVTQTGGTGIYGESTASATWFNGYLVKAA